MNKNVKILVIVAISLVASCIFFTVSVASIGWAAHFLFGFKNLSIASLYGLPAFALLYIMGSILYFFGLAKLMKLTKLI